MLKTEKKMNLQHGKAEGENEGKRWMVRNLFVRTNGSPKAKMRKMDDSWEKRKCLKNDELKKKGKKKRLDKYSCHGGRMKGITLKILSIDPLKQQILINWLIETLMAYIFTYTIFTNKIFPPQNKHQL